MKKFLKFVDILGSQILDLFLMGATQSIII
jgi:hypothetical protein